MNFRDRYQCHRLLQEGSLWADWLHRNWRTILLIWRIIDLNRLRFVCVSPKLDVFIQLFFHFTPREGFCASSRFIFFDDAARCLPACTPAASLSIWPQRRDQRCNWRCPARCIFQLNHNLVTLLKNVLYFAVRRIDLSLGAFSNIVNDGKECIRIDFFGSDLLPIQNVLSWMWS